MNLGRSRNLHAPRTDHSAKRDPGQRDAEHASDACQRDMLGEQLRDDSSARRPRSQPPSPSPPMKIATTAAEDAVENPKTRRSSRIQAIW